MPDELQHVSVQFPLLFGGISDQPAIIRFRNQLERADNTTFLALDGASKRPGTQFVSAVTVLPTSGGSGVSDLPSLPISGFEPSGGDAPCSCVPGDFASTYSVAFNLTVKIADSTCTATACNQAAIVVTQVASQCIWFSNAFSLCSTTKGSVGGRAALSLNTEPDCQWNLTLIFFIPSRPVSEVPFVSFQRSKGAVTPIGNFSGTQSSGDCTQSTWQFDLTTVSIT